jgi:hypothetical protein
MQCERNLAACAVSIAGLQDAVSVAQALSSRQELLLRVGGACQALGPLLQQWGHMREGHAGAADSVLHAIGNALTHIPLINGASCSPAPGAAQGGALGALQGALDRGLGALVVRSWRKKHGS